jgi:transposase InsO family protein
VGDVLKERNGGHIYIVLKTGKNSRWTHLIDIEQEAKSAACRKAEPLKLRTEELLQRLSEDGEPYIALETVPKLPENISERRRVLPFVRSRRSEKYKEIAEEPTKSKGWQLISGLLTFDLPDNDDGTRPPPSIYGDAFEELLHPETRRKRILRYCEVSGISESTVFRTFRRFCQQGLTPAAASDSYDLCGGKGNQRNCERTPGRKPKNKRLSASARNQEVRRLLELGADYYLSFEYSKGKRSQKTFKQALSWLQATFLQHRVVYNENMEMVELTLDHRVVLTVRQLQYFVYQNYSYEVRRIHEVGLRRYLLHERPLTGRLRTSRGPGERFHIDATILDIYLIGQILRTKVIGRPVLYLVIDDYSEMCVGFYLTFEPPCWDGAMMALANAISPKIPFCESLGIHIKEGQWPAHRLPEVIYADQGEVSSIHKAHPLISHFRVEVSNAPAYRPDLRSLMERRFGIIPAIWNSLVPGIVEKGSFDRGVEHPAYHAALNIQEMRRIICYAVLNYNKRIIRGYPTPPEMVDRELAPTPLNLWTYGTEVNGSGRHVDVADFRTKVMPKTTVPIDGNGIRHNGMHYACPSFSLVERQAMFRGQKTETNVEIGYDSADNSSVQLHGLGEPISCPLSERVIKKLHGLTYREQKLYKDLNATAGGMAEEAGEAERAMTDYNIAKIAKNAVSQTSAALRDAGITKPDISDMDEMRHLERSVDTPSGATPGAVKASPRGSRNKIGASFKQRVEKAQQKVSRENQKPEAKYDEEGDAYDVSVNPGNDTAVVAGRMTAKDLGEKRARELLAAMDV